MLSEIMSLRQISINGYIVRLRYPSHERLRSLKIYSSSSDLLARVADELAPILLEIDRKYARREYGRKSRNLRASFRYYYEERDGGDTKVLRVIPYPSSFVNILSNIRRDIYNILKRYCLPIINLNGRYIYAAPPNIIEKISDEVAKINQKLETLRQMIDAFDMSSDREMIENKLREFGVKYEFKVPDIFDVKILTLHLSISGEIAEQLLSSYTKERIESAIGNVMANITSGIKSELKPIIDKLRKRRSIKRVKEDLKLLDEKLRGMGLDIIADELEPLMELTEKSDIENFEDLVDDISKNIDEALSKYEIPGEAEENML